jgi:hypothetical protein
MSSQTHKRQDKAISPGATVTKWMVLGSPFACALGYLLLK